MNVDKVSLLSMECKPRKMDFIKYTNDKSSANHVVEDCFNKSLVRENSLVSLNFLA